LKSPSEHWRFLAVARNDIISGNDKGDGGVSP